MSMRTISGLFRGWESSNGLWRHGLRRPLHACSSHLILATTSLFWLLIRSSVTQSKSVVYFLGGWRLRCGRVPSSEIKVVAEARDDSSRRAVVGEEADMEGDSVGSSGRKRSCSSRVGSGGVVSPSGGFAASWARSETHGLLEGVDV